MPNSRRAIGPCRGTWQAQGKNRWQQDRQPAYLHNGNLHGRSLFYFCSQSRSYGSPSIIRRYVCLREKFILPSNINPRLETSSVFGWLPLPTYAGLKPCAGGAARRRPAEAGTRGASAIWSADHTERRRKHVPRQNSSPPTLCLDNLGAYALDKAGSRFLRPSLHPSQEEHPRGDSLWFDAKPIDDDPTASHVPASAGLRRAAPPAQGFSPAYVVGKSLARKRFGV